MFKRIFALILGLLVFSNLYAQQAVDNGVEMADRLRADGMIYVVVAVVSVILAGIVVYLIRIDRKISKLEKEI